MRNFLLVLAVAVGAGCTSRETPQAAAGPAANLGSLKISGPFIHENLALYVVEDPAAAGSTEFITLAEGLSSGAVKVSEKKDAQVSELLIENQSDKPCFVQAGDVVKGGQQDRAISSDFVIPPRTGATPVSSFCVEQSRWNGQAKFDSSTQNAYAKDLKLAVQKEQSQGKVWQEVEANKKRLVDNNGLRASRSTSLNEELEDGKIQDRLKAFRAALGKVIEDKPQAIGLLTAVNGSFSTGDLYAHPALFRKLYARLLDSAAMETLATKPESKPAPKTADAAAFLADAEKGKTSKEEGRKGLDGVTTENDQSVQFDYNWQNYRLHRQTLSK